MQGCPNATLRLVRDGDTTVDEVKLAFCRANMLPADTCALSGDGPLVKHLPKFPSVPSTKVLCDAPREADDRIYILSACQKCWSVEVYIASKLM